MTASIALLLLVAGAVRLWRLDFDLPEVVYVDGFKFVGEAARMVETGGLRPLVFQYPGLYTDVLAALFRVFGIESAYGRELAATAVAAGAGTLVVGATGFAARAVSGAPGTMIAVALAAVSPALVTQARTPAPDTLCVLFATVALGIAARRPSSPWSWAGAGIAAGLAVGSKWTGAFVAVPVAAAAAAAAWQRRRPGLLAVALAVSGTAALLTLWATTPFLLAEREAYVRSAEWTSLTVRSGQIGRVLLGPLDYVVSGTPTWEAPWLGTSLLAELGLPTLVLAAGGVALAAAGRLGFGGVFYAAVALAYLAGISGTGWIKAVRFLLPCLPLAWVLAGACVEWLLPRTGARRAVVAVVLAALALAAPMRTTAAYIGALGRPSTNRLAREWLRGNVPADATVFLGPLFTNDLVVLPFRLQQFGQIGGRIYGYPPEAGPSPETRPIYHPGLVDDLRRRGVEWIILNSYFDDAFSPVPENLRFFPNAVRQYEGFLGSLREQAELVHEETGWAERRLGPDIRIWRLRPRPG